MVSTARRDRPPSGQVNRPKTAGPLPSARMGFSNRNDSSSDIKKEVSNETFFPNLASDRKPPKDPSSRPESERSEISTNELMRRLRERSDLEKNQRALREINAMGPYNAFSRPKSSIVAPLRSVLLDPSVNNFPKSKTRTELMRRVKTSGMPHPSYDLDMDGYVSQQDFKLAKKFDFDGNGVLDPEERQIGRKILAEEFFKRHVSDLHNFGPQFQNSSIKQNVEKLVNSYSFERSYDKLCSVERTLIAESSKPILDCMRNEDEKFRKYKYFTDKFDSTAWTDFERIPRTSWTGHQSTMLDEHDHGGSRRRLLMTRRENLRTETQQKLDFAQSLRPKSGSPAGRINLISDVRVENS